MRVGGHWRLLGPAIVVALGCRAADSRADAARAAPLPLQEVTPSARPAPGPYPAPPGIEFTPGEAPPAPAPLVRDAAVVGRLTAEGQRAVLTFDAAAGELALFELTTYGFARGWDAASELLVRDAAGAELRRSRREGGALFGDLLDFVAPATGAYTLEVVAARHHFRYLVVRHAGYAPQAPGTAFALRGAADELAHGYTAGSGTTQRFVVHAAPGAVVALRAEPTAERGRKHERDLRARAAAVAAGLVDARRLAERLDPRQIEDRTFPDLALQVEGGEVLVQGTFSAVARVGARGAVEVVVSQREEGPCLLFDLVVERGVALEPCAVRLGDVDDAPVAGAEVALLREPALERFGRATTGADGAATFQVAPGPYTLVFRAPGRGPEVVRTTLRGGEPVNLALAR